VTADRPIRPTADPPALRITSGNPTEDELAAVTAVLLSLAATAPGAEPASRPTGWSDLTLRLRRPLPTGPDAWRNSRWQ
jgi:hypothetical protein